MFSALDWVTFIVYLVSMAWMGYYFSKKNTSFHEYMFGSGQMPWPAIGISLVATSVSATTFLGNPADTYANDMTYIMLNAGVFLAIMVVALVFIPRYRRLKALSAYEVLELRFGRRVRHVAAGFYTCHLLMRTGVLIYGPAIVLSDMVGINIYLAICLMAILTIGYTWSGGFQAVVWTDVIQFFVLLGGGLAALWYCAQGVGGFGEMRALAEQTGKSVWFRSGFDPTNARTLLSASLVYMVFEVAIRGCDQQFVQRYQACKDIRAANLSSLLSAVLGLGVSLVFFWVGAGLYVYYHGGPGVLPENIRVDRIFPHFIFHELPTGMVGLLSAAIFAAAMSSLDSAITALSNTTVRDFYPNSTKEQDEVNLNRAKTWTVIWGAVGTLAAFLCVWDGQSLLSKALFFTSLFTGPLLGLFVLAFFFPRTNPKAVLLGTFGGMVTLLLFSRIPILPEGWWEPFYQFSWPWNPLVSLTGMMIVTGLLSFVLPQQPLGRSKTTV